MLNYPNYMRNVAAVAATQKDGEHRYYLPKKYLKKNEGYLVKESKCGCMDIYKINRLEQKKWSQKYKKSIDNMAIRVYNVYSSAICMFTLCRPLVYIYIQST